MRRSSSKIDCNGVVLDDKLVDEFEFRIRSAFDAFSSLTTLSLDCGDDGSSSFVSISVLSMIDVAGFQSGYTRLYGSFDDDAIVGLVTVVVTAARSSGNGSNLLRLSSGGK